MPVVEAVPPISALLVLKLLELCDAIDRSDGCRSDGALTLWSGSNDRIVRIGIIRIVGVVVVDRTNRVLDPFFVASVDRAVPF